MDRRGRGWWGFAVTTGASMRPTLASGDRLWVSYRRSVRPGAVVVARFPDGVLVVKRATHARTSPTGEPGWWLLSDAPDQGVDSRHRGVIAESEVLGVVLARVWPRPRLLLPRNR